MNPPPKMTQIIKRNHKKAQFLSYFSIYIFCPYAKKSAGYRELAQLALILVPNNLSKKHGWQNP